MSANQPPFLSVIVPAYNESASLADTLASIQRYLAARSPAYEVIVCADGTDGTREAAAAFACGDARFRVLGSPQRRGKGRGVREGMLAAQGEVIGFMDADNKTPIEELDKLLPFFQQEFEVVIGSRKVRDAQVEVLQPLYRRMGSRAFGMAMRRIVGLHGIHDTQCGFKFFTRAAGRRLFSLQRIDGYMFDVEVLRLAKRLGYGIQEVGVRWRDDGDSRYHPISGTIRNARELLRLRAMQYDLVGQTSPEGNDDRSARRAA